MVPLLEASGIGFSINASRLICRPPCPAKPMTSGARCPGTHTKLARELGSIAEEGLKRQGALDSEGRDERVYLERLREGLRAGKSPAYLLADRWSGEWHQEARHLVAATAFP